MDPIFVVCYSDLPPHTRGDWWKPQAYRSGQDAMKAVDECMTKYGGAHGFLASPDDGAHVWLRWDRADEKVRIWLERLDVVAASCFHCSCKTVYKKPCCYCERLTPTGERPTTCCLML